MTSAGNGSNNVKNAVGRINRIGVLTIDAYGVAVKNGYKGTVEEWLESLKAFSPKVEVFGLIEDFVNEDGDSERREGAKIAITDENGTKEVKVWNGKDGNDGVSPTVETFGTFEDWVTEDGATKIREGVKISITDKNGTQEVKVWNGKDGVSPTVSVTDTEAGHRVAVTDLNGTKSFDVLNGQKGDKGDRGEAGYTPVKGVDYFDGEDGKDGTMTFEELTEEQKASLKGKDGVSCTHSWNGTTLSVTSASGTSSADLKGDKGDKGDTGATGPAYTLTDTDKNSIATAVKNSLTPASIGAAASTHNQAASTITAGTFAGQVAANSSGQAPGASLLRNSKLASAETNPTVNGEICWTYE